MSKELCDDDAVYSTAGISLGMIDWEKLWEFSQTSGSLRDKVATRHLSIQRRLRTTSVHNEQSPQKRNRVEQYLRGLVMLIAAVAVAAFSEKSVKSKSNRSFESNGSKVLKEKNRVEQ